MPVLKHLQNFCSDCEWGRSVLLLLGDTAGATAIEYGLIAVLIAVAGVVVMGTIGTNLSGTFSNVANNL